MVDAADQIVTPPPAAKQDAIVLCLSGGGFRATLFHLGALRRLNEMRILQRVSVITSVSGGSILNGVLATQWKHLKRRKDGFFENFDAVFAEPVRAFCKCDIRTRVLIGCRLNPLNLPVLLRDFFAVNANFLAEEYQRRLFGPVLLSELLPPETGIVPRFVFCTTSLQTGACWHFHGGPQARMGDFYTGYVDVGDVSVAEAVAASSAFPPGFAALRLSTKRLGAYSRIDPWGRHRPETKKRKPPHERTMRQILLTDGGVYDNLGVEPVWDSPDCILVSDAGRPFSSKGECRQSIGSRLGRAFEIAAEQVGAVRKRWLVKKFVQGERRGGLWAINTPINDYKVDATNGYGEDVQFLICQIRTDMNVFTDGEIGCLENHGYSLTDAAIRSRTPYLVTGTVDEFKWPQPTWSSDTAARSVLLRSGSRSIARDVVGFLREYFAGNRT